MDKETPKFSVPASPAKAAPTPATAPQLVRVKLLGGNLLVEFKIGDIPYNATLTAGDSIDVEPETAKAWVKAHRGLIVIETQPSR